jgi:hypothetical protein
MARTGRPPAVRYQRSLLVPAALNPNCCLAHISHGQFKQMSCACPARNLKQQDEQLFSVFSLEMASLIIIVSRSEDQVLPCCSLCADE